MLQANATKVQKRMRRARTAAQQAADVVEHIISVVGDDYLETAQHLYSWLQLSMIDVYIAIIAVIAVAAALAGGLVWLLLRLCRLTIRQLASKRKMS